jgi:hypothetical protein
MKQLIFTGVLPVVVVADSRSEKISAAPVATKPRDTARQPTRPVAESLGCMRCRMPVAMQQHFV